MALITPNTQIDTINILQEANSAENGDYFLLQRGSTSYKVRKDEIINETVLFDKLYPIGSVYTNATDSTNPSTLLGFGSWTRIGQGRVLIGEGSGTDINSESKTFTNGSSGGEYEHQLTEAELASHSHAVNTGGNSGGFVGQNQGSNHTEGGVAGSRRGGTAQPTGGNQAHNNIQPYLTVYMWKRTA